MNLVGVRLMVPSHSCFFPILLCQHLVFAGNYFDMKYEILFPVATRLEAPSWYHFSCLEDGRDAGLITIQVAQRSQLREPATWAVFGNRRLCLAMHARQDSASYV